MLRSKIVAEKSEHPETTATVSSIHANPRSNYTKRARKTKQKYRQTKESENTGTNSKEPLTF
jgi:hypothetical protein